VVRSNGKGASKLAIFRKESTEASEHAPAPEAQLIVKTEAPIVLADRP
jgi:hypothetical protein